MWVSTDNNMVSESGPTEIRYAPAPERFDLTDASREIVMDRHAWTYTLAAEKCAVKGKSTTAHRRLRPDPGPAPLRLRRGLHRPVERGGQVLGARDGRRDRALVRFRSRPASVPHRPHRLLRGAVPLPPGAGPPDAIRFRASTLPPRRSHLQPMPGLSAGPRQQGLHRRRGLSAAAVVVFLDGQCAAGARRRLARAHVSIVRAAKAGATYRVVSRPIGLRCAVRLGCAVVAQD